VATLDWSYDLFPDVEQAVLRRLSVFAGDFTLEAAVAVADDESSTGSDVVAAVANLTAKSLVSADVSARIAHYRLLDTTSAYARRKLNQVAEFEAAALRHADYFRELFDRAEIGTVNQSATAGEPLTPGTSTTCAPRSTGRFRRTGMCPSASPWRSRPCRCG
jgi:predicted ATPase